jgi:hypothetical protein
MKWSIIYNRSLVRRGEILLGFYVINKGCRAIKEMNKDKVGREPFHYPTNSFLLLLLGYAKAYFHLPYRQTKEGIAQGHAKWKSTFHF